MKVIRNIEELKVLVSAHKSRNQTIGFVPTMGALHEGHLSLVERSLEECSLTVVSIYVNPSQFNESSDFDKYPRNEKADLTLLESVNCDVVFIPTVEEVQSLPKPSSVNIGDLADVMEGKERPGHFEGVIEVVYRLFLAVNPDLAFFGEKDYQQIMVVRKMVEDTKLDVQVVDCPIKRESSGLAMSSRNVRLSSHGKTFAASIYSVLNDTTYKSSMEKSKKLDELGFEVEYVEVHKLGVSSRLFAAVWLEGVRLIDNIAVV